MLYPAKAIFLDFETASGADLRAVGGRVYARHPSTRIICAHAIAGGQSFTLHFGDDPIKWATGIYKATPYRSFIVAHNGDMFDRFIAERFCPDLLHLPWVDTIHMARTGGLPAGLDSLMQHFLGEGKDAGREMMLRVSKLVKQADGSWGNKWMQSGYIGVVEKYCVKDVEGLQRIFPHLLPYYKPDAIALDNAINRRGIGFDEKLAAKIAECSAQLVAESGTQIFALTNGKLKPDDLRSIPKMSMWLASQGVHLANLRKETVKKFIEGSIHTPVERLIADDEELQLFGEAITNKVKDVLRLRSAALRITAGKLERASQVAIDGRLHDMRVHNGAFTSRRTGRIVQPHNLPSGLDDLGTEGLCSNLSLDAVRTESARLKCSPDDVLSSLIRPCMVPMEGYVFVIADFSQIELRLAAWVAGQQSLLDTFRAGGDPYTTSAAGLFKCKPEEVTKAQRKVGKIAVLSGQYGGGAGTLNAFAVNNGVKFNKIGMTALEVVEGFRDAFPEIAGEWTGSYFKGVKCRKGGIWKRLDAAFRQAINGDFVQVGPVSYQKDGTNVVLRLSSGKEITYRQAAVEKVLFPNDDEPRDAICFNHPTNGRRTTHGGPLLQNICEAYGNDLLNLALQEAETCNYRPVLEVHDELVLEVKSGMGLYVLNEMIAVMSQVPPWATGLPIKATGHVAPRYVKSPWKGWYHR
jgi:DNA polymerase